MVKTKHRDHFVCKKMVKAYWYFWSIHFTSLVFEFMWNICCFDLFPFNLFTCKTKFVMLWLKRIKDQIVEKKYFEQEFHQVSTSFFQIKCFQCLHFFFWKRDCVYDIDENSIECDECDQKIKLERFCLFFEFMSNFLTF